MKQAILLAAAALAMTVLSSPGMAQQSMASQYNVTSQAKMAFEAKFPNAQNAQWKKEGERLEVEFNANGKDMSAIFDKQGNWKETEQMISNDQIPSAVMKYVHQHYQNETPRQPAKLWRPGGKILYELEVNGVNRDLVFTPEGKLLDNSRYSEESAENAESAEQGETGEAVEAREKDEARAGSSATAHAIAKISMAQARRIALNAFPGKIVTEELEREKGGSGLRYSFNIKKGNTVHEVGVDAMTGKLLQNGPADND